MRTSDKLRLAWLDREGHHSILTTLNGPYRCYSAWEAWAWVAAIVVLFAVLWGGTP